MKPKHKNLKLFLLGAAGYPLLEIAWRGRTTLSMAAAGGAGLCLLNRLSRSMAGRPMWQKSLVGGAAITALEYAAGGLCNRRHQVWDYSGMPFNIQGQVCPPYAALWCLLSLPVFPLLDKLRQNS